MYRVSRLSTIFLALLSSWLAAASAPARAAEGDAIPVYAGDFAPYVTRGEDGATGLMVDLLREIETRTGLAFKVRIVPWARAQHFVSRVKRKAMIIPLTRTTQREPLYDWVVPLLRDPLALMVTDPALNRSSFEAMRDLRVGVQAESPNERLLERMGFTALQVTNDEKTSARLLNRGRIEAWFARPMVARQVYKKVGGDPKELVVGPQRRTPPMYLGAAKDRFATATLAAIRNAFDAMRASGAYARITSRY